MRRSTRQNILFALAVLMLAGALWLLLPRGGQGVSAKVTFSDGTEQKISLESDGQYDFSTASGITVHLVVENKSIRFADSECPDHRCEGFGLLRQEGDWAACMPAKVSVSIE